MKPVKVLLAVLPCLANALDNGLAQTPPMGYNSWYDVACGKKHMNEATMRQVADAMVELGLLQLGYKYLNLDDCWAKGRDDDGRLMADNSTFPSGTLKELADYVHSKGLLFGTYTDRGSHTCAKRPGALDHETIDAQTYADWGIDYLKEDSCYASSNHQTAFEQYGKMRDALNATGRPVVFSICGWSEWYAPNGTSLGNSWRTGPDDNNWGGILKNIDILPGLEKYAGPGGWNDPCMLLSQNHGGGFRVSELETRAQFSMWAVIAAPLLISGSILELSPFNLETYTNEEVIAVSQDPLGKAGSRIWGTTLHNATKQPSAVNIWARPLQFGSYAIVFLNVGTEATEATCDTTCFAAMGMKCSQTIVVRDLWAKADVQDVTDATLTVQLNATVGFAMFLLTPNVEVSVSV